MIEAIKNEIREIFSNDSGGHDYWHSVRVYRNAMKISEYEGGDRTVIALSAILHDVDDIKLFDTHNYENARKIMSRNGVSSEIQDAVIKIISEVSFRGAESITPSETEGKIVQDADRLDALGAVGIARTFAFGGSNGLDIYNPDIVPVNIENAADYLEHRSSSVNHFYEKLFLIKDMMNTETARRIAETRDKYMHDFLNEFMSEWEGIKVE